MPPKNGNGNEKIPLQFQDDKALIEYGEAMGDVEVALKAGTARLMLAQAHDSRNGILEAERALMGSQSQPDDEMGDIKIRSPENHYHMPPQVPTWLKAASIGALALATGGIGAAIPLVLNALKPAPIAEPAKPQEFEAKFKFEVKDGKMVVEEVKP